MVGGSESGGGRGLIVGGRVIRLDVDDAFRVDMS